MNATTETKTEIASTTQMAQATASQNSRYALTEIGVRPANDDSVFLTATDGKMAVIVKQTGHTDKPVLMPSEMATTNKKPTLVQFNGMWRNTSGKAADAIDDDKVFPPVGEVLPPMTNATNHPEAQKWASVAIDATMLAKLAKAPGGNRVVLTIDLETTASTGLACKPIIVMPMEDHTQSAGVLMPCKGDDDSRTRYETIRTEYLAAEKIK